MNDRNRWWKIVSVGLNYEVWVGRRQEELRHIVIEEWDKGVR